MKHCFLCLGILFSLFFLIPKHLLYAQSAGVSESGEFSLQGDLTSTSGTAIADGMHTLAVNIYNAVSGQIVYSEMDTVSTTKGIFSTMIGANGSSTLHLAGNTMYNLGVAVDGQAELLPRIRIGQAPQAITAATADTASLALNANTVAGFAVDTIGMPVAHSLVALNASGQLAAGILDSSAVTSINGVHGALNITGGGNLNVSTSQGAGGTTLNLSFTGSGAGLTLPFMQSLNLSTGTGFSITNTLAGTAASFVNTGLGNALSASATTGSAISATATGTLNSAATINAQNTAGAALNATSSAGSAITASATGATNPVLQLQATGSAATSTLLNAKDATGDNVLSVGSNGSMQINSTASTALQAMTSATGGTAAKFVGGLSLVGPVGVGQISAGQTSATISNALVKSSSMVFVTLTSAAGISIPLTVTGVTDGSFTIAPVGGLSLANTLNFNYLIVNSQ